MASGSQALIQFVEELAATPDYDWKPTVAEPSFVERRLKPCAAPEIPQAVGSVEDARSLIRSSIRQYLEIPIPDHMLLIRALPGTGKTTAAAEIVDELARAGVRVMYAGPRHDFFGDVVSKSAMPGQWYEWLPRQLEDADNGKVETCRYTEQINGWLARGYDAMSFCSGVCGWDYVNKTCPYHAQKKRTEPVIYAQHQHVSLGHPMQFGVLFGDESPIGAFLREWDIPARWVLPPGMPTEEPLTEILYTLSTLVQTAPRSIEGPELLRLLGGAAEVLAACEGYQMPVEMLASGKIYRADEVEKAPYFHLPDLVRLLAREARACVAGQKYPHRVIVSHKRAHLTLMLRRYIDKQKIPQHIIWLDATGRPEIYSELFRRRVEVIDARPQMQGRIYQVVDRSNGKSSIAPSKAEQVRTRKPGRAEKALQVEKLIETVIANYGYQRPTLISYKGFIEETGLEIPSLKTGHFYGNRGTNEHEDADAVFILGTPQANIYDVVKTAKMVYFDRETAFKVEWSVQEQTYMHVAADGLGRCYPVSGFWGDGDLQTMLEVIREDEIIQAAHRGRPVNHPVDIWLFTNVPIPTLPPDELLTMRDILEAPQGVDIWKWRKVQALMAANDAITVSDLTGLGFNYETARGYLERIVETPGWEKGAIKSRRGKPTLVASRTEAP